MSNRNLLPTKTLKLCLHGAGYTNVQTYIQSGNVVLDAEPPLDQAKLDLLLAASERYALCHDVFYLHAPDGIERSKRVANIDYCLSVPATGRNLNTVGKIARMLGAD